MKRALIALFLSALIFPGLGQIYNRDLKKGLFLILLATLGVTIIFLGGLILLSYQCAAVYPTPLNKAIFQEMLLRVLLHPLILCAISLFLGVWVFAALDAFRTSRRLPEKELP
jgi:TM2 domain-containing membrane protein YozV